MGSVKILSVNCQGLGNTEKRKDVFNLLRSKSYNIYCLQDTHFTCDAEKDIRSMWGFECYFSSYSSNSRGVSIMFNNNFEFKVLKEKRDIHGNYLALDIELDKMKVTLLSLYGPNTDSPAFFDDIMNIIDDFGNESYIICGDFNLVLRPDIDYNNYCHVNNPKAREKVLEIVDERCLIDPFRELFPNLHRYTWRKKNPLKQARLDFFLCTEDMLTNLKDSKIEFSYRSDHSMIVLELEFNPFLRGKGLWKFNNSLLYDKEYIDIIKQEIERKLKMQKKKS